MTYHLARNGQQLGTCSREEAIARYARGELLPGDLVWTEGMKEWAPAASVFGSGAAAGAVPPASPAMSTVPSPAGGAPAMSSMGGAVGVPPKKPDNFLVWSILATLLCCLPAGVVAIIYAAQVDGKYTAGDYAGAESSAKNARMWTFISAGVGLAVGLAYAIFMIAAGVASANSY